MTVYVTHNYTTYLFDDIQPAPGPQVHVSTPYLVRDRLYALPGLRELVQLVQLVSSQIVMRSWKSPRILPSFL